jgi:hypothetical protein
MPTPLSAGSATPMPDTPLKALTDELGAIVGRLEREVRSDVRAQIAQLEVMKAEFEIVVMRFEQETKARLDAVVSTVRDGHDGRDGEPGPPGEQGPPGERGAAAEIPLCPPEIADQITRALVLIAAR